MQASGRCNAEVVGERCAYSERRQVLLKTPQPLRRKLDAQRRNLQALAQCTNTYAGCIVKLRSAPATSVLTNPNPEGPENCYECANNKHITPECKIDPQCRCRVHGTLCLRIVQNITRSTSHQQKLFPNIWTGKLRYFCALY